MQCSIATTGWCPSPIPVACELALSTSKISGFALDEVQFYSEPEAEYDP